MVDPENENVGKFVETWNRYAEANPDQELMEITADNISVSKYWGFADEWSF